jgi:DNA-binding XRE family transcriptional regulator
MAIPGASSRINRENPSSSRSMSGIASRVVTPRRRVFGFRGLRASKPMNSRALGSPARKALSPIFMGLPRGHERVGSGYGCNSCSSIIIIPEYWYEYQSTGIRILGRTRKSVRMAREHQSLQIRFGQRIKRLREARGWSFTYLSVHSGLAKNTIVEVEGGRTEPRLNTVAALAGSFGKTLSELLRGL